MRRLKNIRMVKVLLLIIIPFIITACGGESTPTVDTSPPEITLIGVNPQELTIGDSYEELGATATDNVDKNATITSAIAIDATAINNSVVGKYRVVYNVTDAAGNVAAEVSRTVNVISALDTTAPVIRLIGTNPQELTIGDSYEELGAIATDNVDENATIISAIEINATAINNSEEGNYRVTYNVTDTAGNVASEVTRMINVVAAPLLPDSKAPEITLTGENPQVVTLGDNYEELGATATDNEDATITSAIAINATAVNTEVVGTYIVTYTVTDAAGNIATAVSRTVNVIAPVDTPPEITLRGESRVEVVQGSTYTDAGAIANDNIDGDITSGIVTVNSVKTGTVGTYMVTYNVKDRAGNQAVEVSRTVNVVANMTFPISAKPWGHGKLEVSADGHMLQHEDGKGFFWMADTAWFIFSDMTREEVDKYLTDRANRGFTVVLTNIMSRVYNKNRYGDAPYKVDWMGYPGKDYKPEVLYKPYFIDEFITTPGNISSDEEYADSNESDKYDYWDHVDYVIDKAAEKGIYIAMTLTWLDGVQNYIERNETIYTNYATWLGKRYKDKPNIVWLNGGDVYSEEEGENEVWDWLGDGIKSVDENHLMSWHGMSSSRYHHHKDWLDFNMVEGGHNRDLASQNIKIKNDYDGKTPLKPIIDGETRYEGIEDDENGGNIKPIDVREIAYYQLFTGAFGHTYGHNAIWQVATRADVDTDREYAYKPKMTWEEALPSPGAQQMNYLSNLMQSRPILGRLPDQSIISSGKAVATRGDGYALIYLTSGESIDIRLDKISGDNVKIWSYNPRTGASKVLEASKPNSGIYTFNPEGGNEFENDWVVVIDDLSKGFPEPGK